MIEVLEHVALECGMLVLKLRAEAMEAENKDEQLGAHFSTRADRDSQELGLRILARELPEEHVIAEESEHDLSVPLNCTVFDPLDGTAGYFNGLDDFSVSLCTITGGKLAAGVTYFPVRDQLVSAVRHEGCYVGGFRKGRRIFNIAWHGVRDKTLIGTDVGPWTIKSHSFERVLRHIAKRYNVISPMCATEGARKVLLGELGAYYNFGVAKIWDAAAMSLAIKEAGGVVMNPAGLSMRWDTVHCDWVVAGHADVAKIMAEFTRNWRRV